MNTSLSLCNNNVLHDSSVLGLSLEFSSEVTDFVNSLANEDLSFVADRLVVRDGIERIIADNLKTEFLRFVALRKYNTGMLIPSALVDKFWHAFILHTEEYGDFCLRHLGYYMHHRPQDHSKTNVINDNIVAKRTMECLEKMFPDYDKQLWSDSAICSNDGDCGCP